jgi:hypothetical protein
MHFTTPALLALISTPLAFAAPSGSKHDYKTDCKKDWDAKWNAKDNSWKKNEKLFYFDAEYVVKATPDTVIATTGAPAPGQPGAKGLFKYGINIAENTICYNITLSGVTGEYQSAALTATHIHEAVKGKAGPPRLVSCSLFHPTPQIKTFTNTLPRPSPTPPAQMSAALLTAASRDPSPLALSTQQLRRIRLMASMSSRL